MTKNQLLHADLLDIIFDNRNKEYGAYVLRREYPKNLMKAIGCMLLFAAAVCASAFINPKKIDQPSLRGRDTVEVILDPYKEKPKEPNEVRKVPEQPATKRDYVPVIVDNPDSTKLMPDRTDTSTYVPGPENKPATGNGNEYVQGEKIEKTEVEVQPEVKEPDIIDQADADLQPEFPGGVEAWRKYLSQMLRVPDDLQEGERKTVRVKFVVNANGEITDVMVIQSAGTIFDREVLRVIGKMPKWKPGRHHGKNIAVYFTQPITFVGEAE